MTPSSDLEVTVVLPAKNAERTIAGQLRALAVQDVDCRWELVVVDNGSTDATVAVAETFASELPLRVISAPGAGANAARNAGARVAAGRLLLFCDADDEVGDGWITSMARALSDCDAVGGNLDRRSLNPNPVGVARPERVQELTRHLGFLPSAVGANCGVQAHVFTALGGFDESWPQGGDEVEFFWRLQLAGFSLCFAPDAVVRYRDRDTLTGVMRQAYRYAQQDPLLFRRFRRDGLQRSSLRDAVAVWARLVLLGPWYWSTRLGRAWWVRRLAERSGRLVGSLRHRVWFP